ncbi:collagen alpha-1(I) chain-like isoform X3 [Sorex araneus]|uniref:collagen alpha-1(I) chain-like isoform X3 n=1 Tax=Sorex araneus TaxID=42254 RepID=UPI0024333BA6|nr:collagen alpha-1(I) chain-like isoform X3 [Sorex araneus]
MRDSFVHVLPRSVSSVSILGGSVLCGAGARGAVGGLRAPSAAPSSVPDGKWGAAGAPSRRAGARAPAHAASRRPRRAGSSLALRAVFGHRARASPARPAPGSRAERTIRGPARRGAGEEGPGPEGASEPAARGRGHLIAATGKEKQLQPSASSSRGAAVGRARGRGALGTAGTPRARGFPLSAPLSAPSHRPRRCCFAPEKGKRKRIRAGRCGSPDVHSPPTSTTLLLQPAPRCSSSQYHAAPPASTTLLLQPAPRCSSSQYHAAPPASTTLLLQPAPRCSSSQYHAAPPASTTLLLQPVPRCSSSQYHAAPPASTTLATSRHQQWMQEEARAHPAASRAAPGGKTLPVA